MRLHLHVPSTTRMGTCRSGGVQSGTAIGCGCLPAAVRLLQALMAGLTSALLALLLLGLEDKHAQEQASLALRWAGCCMALAP